MADGTLKFDNSSALMKFAGDSFLKEERYGDAIDCYFRALKTSRRNVDGIMSKIAYVYQLTGDGIQAITWYLRALSRNPQNGDVYPGLVHEFSQLGYEMRDTAMYYFTLGKMRNIVTEGEIEDLNDMAASADDDAEEDMEVVDRCGYTDEERLVDDLNSAMRFERAGRYMKEHAAEAAYALFGSVDRKDSHYIGARRMMMKIEYERGDFTGAAMTAGELLKVNPADEEALIYSAAANHELGDCKERDRCYNMVVPSSELSCEDLELLAKVAWNIGDLTAAKKHLSSVQRYLPWDRNALLHLSLCCANLGEKENAKKYIVEAMRLYPDDLTLKYYSDRIAEGDANFTMTDAVPDKEADRREDLLDDWMAERATVEAVTEGLKKDPQMREYLDWLFQEGDIGLQVDIARFLAQNGKWKDFLECQLLMPDAPEELKKNILIEMFDSQCDCAVNATTGNFFRRLNYCPPKDLCAEARDVYRYAYVSLAFYCDGFIPALDAVVLRLNEKLKALAPNDERDLLALAAAVCYLGNVTRDGLKKSDCQLIFGCDKKRFERYLSDKTLDMKGLRLPNKVRKIVRSDV